MLAFGTNGSRQEIEWVPYAKHRVSAFLTDNAPPTPPPRTAAITTAAKAAERMKVVLRRPSIFFCGAMKGGKGVIGGSGGSWEKCRQ